MAQEESSVKANPSQIITNPAASSSIVPSVEFDFEDERSPHLSPLERKERRIVEGGRSTAHEPGYFSCRPTQRPPIPHTNFSDRRTGSERRRNSLRITQHGSGRAGPGISSPNSDGIVSHFLFGLSLQFRPCSPRAVGNLRGLVGLIHAFTVVHSCLLSSCSVLVLLLSTVRVSEVAW